jgi:hypothetical protein
MKKLTKILICVLITVAALSQIAKIYINSATAIESIGATKLTAELEKVQEQNIQIETKVLTYASYTEIASKAAALGYQDNQDIISVYDPAPLAISR